ncbi:VirB4-like conjugal transfer ATPase, CD1110 family [Candidatus Avoscillospira sp. LCP25S3_F1]|uniref:VirB4-like conjugal transfer ATPase, CD1110 family n=1 Tax=Candidatus Avoscillospira sp. LCP25S3_F1 TaxID=3438825 RepID=UPI003F9220EC
MIKPFKGKNPNREKFFIPRSVQQSIPIKNVYGDGTFAVAGLYSKSWRFRDINYAVASQEQQKSIVEQYGIFLNALPARAQATITLVNRALDYRAFERKNLLRLTGGSQDIYCREYNRIVMDAAASSHNIVQEKYVTISLERKTIEEAQSFFSRIGLELNKNLCRLGSSIQDISLADRMRLLHDFFRPEDTGCFSFDLEQIRRSGHDFRDEIAPDCMTFYKDHYELGDWVGRVLFLKQFASYIDDEMLMQLCDLPCNMMISIQILPIPTDEAAKAIQHCIMAIESDINRVDMRHSAQGSLNTSIPYQLRMARDDSAEMFDDLHNRNQELMLAQVIITHMADTMEQLNQDTASMMSIVQGLGCKLSILKYQQEDGLNTALPYGLQRIYNLRSLTTESAAIFVPFRAQELQEDGGIYYGRNAVSNNIILCNRAKLQNSNGFIFGVSGSGKSMAAKWEQAAVALTTNHDIIVVDPEREYGPLIRALGGEVVTISASGSEGGHINAMDLTEGYSEGAKPLVLKCDFVMSLFEQLMGPGKVDAGAKSIIDRCMSNIYREYIKSGYRTQPPTLKELHDDLMRQTLPAAHELALVLEMYSHGNLDVFAHQTTINTNSRILCFDIHDLGESLKPVGLLIMLDAIFNRVIRNRARGRFTHIYIDEIYLFFASGSGSGQSSVNQFSGDFLHKCWKRFRKYGAMMTGITQNVTECLQSDVAKSMLSNSEFLLLFNQAPPDREELAKLLRASDVQMSYVENAAVGHGLMRVGGTLVPFVNEIPQNTELYRLLTTKPGEG